MEIHVCDMCKQLIPKKKLSINGKLVDVLDSGKISCSEWYCEKAFTNIKLCKACAESASIVLNYQLRKLKEDFT